ncbi:glycoside hydrolase family 95 protein [uncultured Lutibacter sp.]|uniref:glycoside hydrolase family 95 protein n=1 Tax=uncultured Lutibacter sp. TaxID=437739 RepID=UPI00262322F6|nr:glycoside hydrolase family 95 protein [uncultured Lutibacter sp.]
MKNIIFVAIICILFSCTSEKKEVALNSNQSLWYNKPSEKWTEALPIGNGRLGAMIYGKPSEEIIQFNEETLWSGQPKDYSNKGSHKYLDSLRNLLWDGKQDEAHKMGNTHFMSKPLRQLSYQPFGKLLLQFPEHLNAENYKRSLNLEDAISRVSYQVNDVKFSREAFASAPDQTIAIKLTADKEGQLNFYTGLITAHNRFDISVEDDVVIVKGKVNNYTSRKKANKKSSEKSSKLDYPESKMTFEARLKVINEGGELIKNTKFIEVKNATSVTLLLVAATNFVDFSDISGNPEERCKQYLANLDGKTYKELKKAHLKEYQKYYKRVQLDFGNSEISKRPTDERLQSFSEDEDPSLVALLYQYGRYLLISSSRPGTQPANLQGIWNDEIAPAWDSKYTLNINAEMNYWPAEITNLSEMAEPFLQLVEDLSITGEKVAKEHYNSSGWMAHHNTDLWRGAAPINNANHGVWPSGGAWASQHLWWHYQFTGDEQFLKEKAYPIMKGASEFFSEYLTLHKENSNWLVSGPSNSPEMGGMVMGPTMDHQIIRNLFTNTIEAAEILNIDADFVKELEDKKSKITPNQIGKYGQLQEWLEDKDDPKNTHRHVSHLWGLHPGNEIHPLTTPELAEACKITLTHRGDGGTGWSRAWKINFWARLLDGDHSFLLLKNLMVPEGSKTGSQHSAGGLYPNLFDAHPPFQIDGNFGATSGITEMLLQSHLRDENGNYYLDILPALPSKLSNGSISGIKGRGGFEVSIIWKDEKLEAVEVKSILGNHLNIRYSGKLISQETKIGETYTFQVTDFK